LIASVGQDFAQTPQAMHLKGLLIPNTVRMELVGQTDTHIRQPMHNDLFSITTPWPLTVKATVGHTATHLWHWLHTLISGGWVLSVITMQLLSGLSSLK